MDERLLISCLETLPKLKITESSFWQESILLNRIASEKVYQECRTKHEALIKSTGLKAMESKIDSKYNLRKFIYD